MENEMTNDNNPALIDIYLEALKMQEKGMSTEEIINSFEGIKRKDNAQGGLNYLMGM